MPDTMMTAEAQIAPKRSAEIKDLAFALVKAQAAMTGASKDATNPHFNRTYADLASVWDAVRKPLTDNDLAIVQFPRTIGQGVEIETTLLHGKTGQFMSDALWVPCSKNDAQGLGSAITYGRRYALMAVCGIAPVDDDGNAAVQTHKPGTPGSAGGGGEFRPERRTAPAGGGQGAALSTAAREIESGEANGTASRKPSPASAKAKQTAADKAKEWTDKAVQTLNLTDATKISLAAFWQDNADKIEWLEENAPKEHERLVIAYDAALDAAKAKVAA